MNKKKIITVISFAILAVICCAIGSMFAKNFIQTSNQIDIKPIENDMSAISNLKQKLIAIYPSEAIGVNLVYKPHDFVTLSISISNLDFVQLPRSDQREKAKEIAIYAKENWQGNPNIEQFVVTFVQEHWVGPFGSVDEFGYNFNVGDLK